MGTKIARKCEGTRWVAAWGEIERKREGQPWWRKEGSCFKDALLAGWAGFCECAAVHSITAVEEKGDMKVAVTAASHPAG